MGVIHLHRFGREVCDLGHTRRIVRLIEKYRKIDTIFIGVPMANPKLKFSHHYPKLHRQTSAELVAVKIRNRADLDSQFINYDTHYVEETPLEGVDGYYQIPNGLCMILYFIGNRGIPFTTIRRAAGDKELYYRSFIGKQVDIVVELESPPVAVQQTTPLGAPNVDA